MYATPQLARKARILAHTPFSETRSWDMGGTKVTISPMPAEMAKTIASVFSSYWTQSVGFDPRGTGGNQNMEMALQFVAQQKELRPASADEVFISPAMAVTFVRKTFDLNIKQLAQVLQVERITVYDWLRKETWSKLHPNRRTRLMNVASLATLWSKLTPLPPGYLLEPLDASGETVLKLLSQASIPANEVMAAHAQLVHNKPLALRVQEYEAARGDSARRVLDSAIAKVHELGID